MKKGLKFLLVSDALSTFALGMIGPIYAIFIEGIGGDILDASWAYFTFTLTSAITIYLIGKWEDHIMHKEKLVAFGYFLTAIGCLGYVFVSNQMELLMVQVVLGIAVAVLSPAFDALYSHYVVGTHEASDWGTWESMGYAVAAIASVAGGYAVHQFGFKFLFMVMFVAAISGAVMSLYLFRDKKYLHQI